ncbi:hypothetical protein [Sorangium sp. So ce1151]|uniref:hypothetical protein n=1 Tax=Sorangium sp. So ce1151 TaxID=3133332 RepID=UPI003F5E2C77
MKGLMEFKVGARTAALGLRFWDPVAAAFVGDGLRVAAYPVADPSRRVEATVNPSRAWVFHKLPGLAVEHGEGDAVFWGAPLKTRSYVIEVDDAQARFVPFQLTVDAPARGPLAWTPPAGVMLPAMPPGAVPLFSTATRTVPQGMGVIRADLWDATAAAPAAWAVLTAAVDGLLGVRGIADAEGKVALIFPYPTPIGGGADGLTGVRLTEQEWPVVLAVRYEPETGRTPERAKLPGVLEQKAGSLWQKWAESAGEREMLAATTLTLAYGEELIVKTASGWGGALFVTP